MDGHDREGEDHGQMWGKDCAQGRKTRTESPRGLVTEPGTFRGCGNEKDRGLGRVWRGLLGDVWALSLLPTRGWRDGQG